MLEKGRSHVAETHPRPRLHARLGVGRRRSLASTKKSRRSSPKASAVGVCLEEVRRRCVGDGRCPGIGEGSQQHVARSGGCRLAPILVPHINRAGRVAVEARAAIRSSESSPKGPLKGSDGVWDRQATSQIVCWCRRGRRLRNGSPRAAEASPRCGAFGGSGKRLLKIGTVCTGAGQTEAVPPWGRDACAYGGRIRDRP